MNILAVGAHPDDIEILCAGTLAKYAKDGHKIFMAHLCHGDLGGKGISRKELLMTRKKEAIEAGKVIGAKVFSGIASDLDLYTDRTARKKAVEIIRQAEPDLIITHAPNDYMPDHRATSRLIFEASFTATLPNYKTRTKAHEPIIPIYYMDNAAGIKFDPTLYVDITKTIDIKKKMLLCHKSQHKWLKGHHNSGAVELIDTLAKFRGLQCGAAYAEAFRILDVWGRNRPGKLTGN
ncbi:MAG: hypothetical protein A2452_01055 [Candidatus Firestonebacteria bacterium RIFOXYC2_FULL_39_67]|nr:MAG: hypothetical protein A2536_11120 [Candidatus Firestonebacteria bacterium RIFOXYD2_FULL_39_29]OGF52209.1 MAG: hypothetical protein A2497_02090 [Candidatus Firestonebacteria bacterium RifOxyC12_full_39_7]OGF54067.1 MAG: hypothetical protein A2452_01055 [Candidatus Firestonebacteria bacterium RIFOXYC2_FULL_39_67]